jgi:erythromycin esterase
LTGKTSLAQWICDHAIVADSLDPQAPLDDLEPLREVIGDARVVAIGENAHHLREFYLLRHRLLRYLVERCGFTVYALEAPFTEGHALDAWVRAGPGTVQEAAAAGMAMGLGRCREMYELLAWIRAQNQVRTSPLRCVGTDVPGSGGSPLPALQDVVDYLRRSDPDALPLLEQAIGLADSFHDTTTVATLSRYDALDRSSQDALSAILSQLLARMNRMTSYQRSQLRAREHAAALHHLRGAWYLDNLHRAAATEGFMAASTFRDAFIAESVMRLLQDGTSDTRIVLAAHNWHIQKTPVAHHGAVDLLPAGYHLAEALADGYVAIAATANRGRTAQLHLIPEHPSGFEFRDAPLPPPVEGSIEAALATRAPLALADLRAARPASHDADSFQRMRMVDDFMEIPVFDAFDAVAQVPSTSCTDYVTATTMLAPSGTPALGVGR